MRKLIIRLLLGADWKSYWKLHEDYTNEISKHIKSLDEKIKLYDQIIKTNEEMLEVLERDQRIIQDNKSLYEICKASGIKVQKDDYFSLN